MKKFLVFSVMSIFMIFSLISCGNNSDAVDTTGSDGVSTEDTDTASTDKVVVTDEVQSDVTANDSSEIGEDTDSPETEDEDESEETGETPSTSGQDEITSYDDESADSDTGSGAVYTVEFYIDGELADTKQFKSGYTLMAKDYPSLPQKPGYEYSWPKVTVGDEDMRIDAICEDNNNLPVHTFE